MHTVRILTVVSVFGQLESKEWRGIPMEVSFSQQKCQTIVTI